MRILSGALSLLAVTTRSIRKSVASDGMKEVGERSFARFLVSLFVFPFFFAGRRENLLVGFSCGSLIATITFDSQMCSCVSRIPPVVQFLQYGTRENSVPLCPDTECSESLKRTVNRYGSDFVCIDIYSIRSDLSRKIRYTGTGASCIYLSRA